MLLVGLLRSIGTMMIGWSKAPEASSRNASVDFLFGKKRANSLRVVVKASDRFPPSLFTVAGEVAIRRGLGTLCFLESQERAMSSSFSKILRSLTSLGIVLPGTRIELPGKDNQPIVSLRSYRTRSTPRYFWSRHS